MAAPLTLWAGSWDSSSRTRGAGCEDGLGFAVGLVVLVPWKRQKEINGRLDTAGAQGQEGSLLASLPPRFLWLEKYSVLLTGLGLNQMAWVGIAALVSGDLCGDSVQQPCVEIQPGVGKGESLLTLSLFCRTGPDSQEWGPRCH
jgi:hypothetical protein